MVIAHNTVRSDRPVYTAIEQINPVEHLKRLGIIMSPRDDEPTEAWGVLNPAIIRGRDGELYLFARVVAQGNYSRIRMARVLFDESGYPVDLERLGFALEPTTAYERRGDSEGGCEDPRITFIPLLDQYVMTYTGFGVDGARVAIAVSSDLFHWERIDVAHFGEQDGIDFDQFDNKDAFFFPDPVIAPDGTLSLACMHRPMTGADRFWNGAPSPHLADLPSSIWVSYVPLADVMSDVRNLVRLGQHQLVARPLYGWEHVKVGGGAPPVRFGDDWLLFYHGIQDQTIPGGPRRLRYAAGMLVVDRYDVTKVLWRSPRPLLIPETEQELCGVVNNVVFPTGIDRVDNNVFDMYYGMADAHIGVARIWM